MLFASSGWSSCRAAGSPSRASQAGAACALVARAPRASAPPTPRPTAARIKLRLVVMCASTPDDAQCSALASFASAALSLALLRGTASAHTQPQGGAVRALNTAGAVLET